MNAFFFSRVSERQRTALLAGLVGLAACGCGAIFNSRQFFVSYLYAYLFWLGLSLGCLCLAMVHHLTGGRWGDLCRRFLEAGYMTLPMMAILFLPILTGLHWLYPWAEADAGGHRDSFLGSLCNWDAAGYLLRAALYFAIWIGLAGSLRKWSLQQDSAGDRQARLLSGPGIAAYALSVTFAWVDWIRPAGAGRYSTLFPAIVCGGQILCTAAFAILMMAHFRNQSPYRDTVEPAHSRQWEALLLTFLAFWACAWLAQLVLVWRGAAPRETLWYLRRSAGGWIWVSAFVTLASLALPLLLLVFHTSKRKFRSLGIFAALVLAVQLINACWLVEPSFFTSGLHLHWMDLAAPIGLGGLWISKCAVSFKRAPLLAGTESRFGYALAHAQ